ncbi:MAG TPA: hypothetical protein PKE30_13110 [Niabella sp.]|nr:hypothetical protein [Niabella sp.]
MDSVTKNRKRLGRGSHKPQPMTKAEMLQKMIKDQETIRTALQNGLTLKELQGKHGFEFATLPDIES